MVTRSTVHQGENARNIIEDFARCVEAVVPLENDASGRVARERAIEQIERLRRHGMGMGIGEEWPRQALVLHGEPTRHVDLSHDPR